MPESEPRSDLTWSDPPPRVRYDWAKIAKQLRRRPNKWALVFERDRTSVAHAIRINSIKPLTRDKGFEVRTSNNTREQPRTCTLHVRYVPEKDQYRKAK